jgi:hypothetical protein
MGHFQDVDFDSLSQRKQTGRQVLNFHREDAKYAKVIEKEAQSKSYILLLFFAFQNFLRGLPFFAMKKDCGHGYNPDHAT